MQDSVKGNETGRVRGTDTRAAVTDGAAQKSVRYIGRGRGKSSYRYVIENSPK